MAWTCAWQCMGKKLSRSWSYSAVESCSCLQGPVVCPGGYLPAYPLPALSQQALPKPAQCRDVRQSGISLRLVQTGTVRCTTGSGHSWIRLHLSHGYRHVCVGSMALAEADGIGSAGCKSPGLDGRKGGQGSNMEQCAWCCEPAGRDISGPRPRQLTTARPPSLSSPSPPCRCSARCRPHTPGAPLPCCTPPVPTRLTGLSTKT